MSHKEKFIKWLEKTFSANSFYSVPPAALEAVAADWDSWREALIAWDILTGSESDEEFQQNLDSLTTDEIQHLAEVLDRIS